MARIIRVKRGSLRIESSHGATFGLVIIGDRARSPRSSASIVRSRSPIKRIVHSDLGPERRGAPGGTRARVRHRDSIAIEQSPSGEVLRGLLVTLFAALMTVVALVGALGPARRGLGVAPAEALRSDE